MTQDFCSQTAQQLGLPLYGTAVNVQVWLVLEYNQPWGVKALPESNLPAVAKEYLQNAEKNIPHSRVQFIKQGESGQQNPSFYVALTQRDNLRTYRFELDSYEALAELDLDQIVEGDTRYDSNLHHDPLYLVCTNGKRDRCCAKWGLPVYQSMADYVGQQAWQTTHIGGHRYAATMICLPHGLCYGYLEPADAKPLIDAYQQNQIWQLDRYRGCTLYDGPTQVAEYFLRQEVGQHGLDYFDWLETNELAPSSSEQRWQIKFKERGQQHCHTLEIGSSMSSTAYPASCEKPAKPVTEYTLEKYII